MPRCGRSGIWNKKMNEAKVDYATPKSPTAPVRWYASMALIFIGVHAILVPLLDLKFDTTPLFWWLHFLDVELLKHQLLESLFYLHIQPPVLNLVAGIMLKLFPESYPDVLYAIYLALGLTQYVLCFALLRIFAISKSLSLALSTAFMLNPAFLLYEHTFFYTLPCTVLLTAAVLALHRYLHSKSATAAAMCLFSLFLLCATRSLFHYMYYVLALIWIVAIAKDHRRIILLVAVLPTFMLFSLYAKNYLIFGNFSLSTLMGRNLWINAVGNMNGAERMRLVEEGKLSEFSAIARWNNIREYPKEYQIVPGFEGIEALHQIEKSNGAHNFNHFGQIAISERYMADALYAIRHHPRAMLATLPYPWFSYFKAYYGAGYNSLQMKPLMRIYDVIFLRSPVDLTSKSQLIRKTRNPPYFALLLGLPLLFIYAIRIMMRGQTHTRLLDPAQRYILAVMCFTIFFVFIVGTTFDFSETNRYRFMTDPMYLAILGIALQNSILPRIRRT